MMKKIELILILLQQIFLLLQQHLVNPQPRNSLDFDDQLTRQEVKDYLGISESTYKRKVKDGTLQPIKMPGGDRFSKSELIGSFLESQRRGRI